MKKTSYQDIKGVRYTERPLEQRKLYSYVVGQAELGYTNAQIGKAVGLSYERVRQIRVKLARDPVSEPRRAARYDYLPRSKKEAKIAGRDFYFTGKLCPRGHKVPRNLHGICIACNAENGRRGKKRSAIDAQVDYLEDCGVI